MFHKITHKKSFSAWATAWKRTGDALSWVLYVHSLQVFLNLEHWFFYQLVEKVTLSYDVGLKVREINMLLTISPHKKLLKILHSEGGEREVRV